jgi:curved DNA-binding protein CbpA
LGVCTAAIVGATAAVGLAASATATGIQQVTTGIVRTPGAFIASTIGADWDPDSEEWQLYSLPDDIVETFNIKDEVLIKIMSGEILLKNMIIEGPRLGAVRDMTFYNRLGLPSTATHAEIKKAYYAKARELHPDKNGVATTNGVNSKRDVNIKFQELGEAYIVLSSEESRAMYDLKGQDEVRNSRATDPGITFSLLFGSEQFEDIVGELWIAPIIYRISGEAPPCKREMALDQRRREIQLAVNMVRKFDFFASNGNTLERLLALSQFKDEAHKEAKELSETRLGASLLGLVGRVYSDRAVGEKSTVMSIVNGIDQYFINFRTYWEIMHTLSFVGSGSAFMVVIGSEPVNEKERAEKRANLEQMYVFDIIFEFAECGSLFIDYMFCRLRLLWQVTTLDIAHTVDAACVKCLRDKSVNDVVIERRRVVMRELGAIYLSYDCDPSVGIRDIVDKFL